MLKQVVGRLFQPEVDFDALSQLLNVLSGGKTSAETLQGQLKWRGHDPAQDRWVVESSENPREFIAHAWTFQQNSERVALYVAVHPGWRRQGIGRFLLSYPINRAKQLGVKFLITWATADDEAGNTFLQGQGFQAMGHDYELEAPVGVAVEAAQWPEGFTIRPFSDVNHLPTFVEALNSCYGPLWGHAENTPGYVTEEKAAETLARHWKAEGVFMVFTSGGQVVGLCVALPGDTVDVLDSPAIHPEYQGMGLLQPLVQHVMNWFQARQQNPIQLLAYGDSLQALVIYMELGFKLVGHEISYRREI